MLFGGVVHEDVDLPQLTFGFRDSRPAESFLPDIARYEETLAALSFDQPPGFPRILVLVQVNDRHIGAFLRKQDGDGPADPAVPTGDERDPVSEFAGADILARAGFRLGAHLGLAPGLTFLMLWRTDFFLFWHGAKESILARPPDAWRCGRDRGEKI
jgi:hypothetical protein